MTEWISVKKRLPEYDIPVLTWDKDYPDRIIPMLLFYTVDGYLWAVQETVWDIKDPTDYVSDDQYTCTHWMSIPDTPNE